MKDLSRDYAVSVAYGDTKREVLAMDVSFRGMEFSSPRASSKDASGLISSPEKLLLSSPGVCQFSLPVPVLLFRL